ncbi:MAG: hypothetical protein JW984_08980 [Deltaproteobacteria bacterium]|uniref:Glycoside hydrolase family 57 N-terminal domain-containing protein n=1 Tax=Candidatus Zymogenus saltonus TaxID=2844893 RepID=A0A9D8KFN7_9DELT|nr:hypothetical protein [Candidatus Zymogenus saltonus]
MKRSRPRRTAHVAFLWHMHQPSYKDPKTGRFLLPFVRLHSAKGYYDMVRLALEYPEMRMNINLVPSLISQIADYTEEPFDSKKDFYVDLALKNPADLTLQERVFIIRNFFMNRWETQVNPYPRYRELLVIRGNNPDGENPEILASRFSDRDIADLQALFNLTWCGYFMRRQYDGIKGLIEKGMDFTEGDKKTIIEAQIDVMKSLIPLYKRASDEGMVELTTSPYYHPILPLLIDTDSAMRAMPDVSLPGRFSSVEDARDQVELGFRYFEEKVGIRPRGLWPPEGSVSPEIIPVIDSLGIEWMATDQDVLLNSHIEGGKGDKRPDIYAPYKATHEGSSVNVVFRDRRLSDLIGFSYASNDPEKAAADFIRQINRIVEKRGGAPTLISVILDGENPWEGYMDGGEGFLRGVYEALTGRDGSIPAWPTTIGEYIDKNPPAKTIDRLHSGSWINHNFGVWIGHLEDNRGWDMVSLAKKHLVEIEEKGGIDALPESLKAARDALYTAEGSDWFWWFGDDFHTDLTDEFDSLFRENLKSVFRLTGAEPPDILSYPISGKARDFDVIPPVGFIEPNVNGKIDDFYEWADAGKYECNPIMGTMFGGRSIVESLHFGFSLENLYVRLDIVDTALLDEGFGVAFHVRGERLFKIEFPLRRGMDKYRLSSRIDDGEYQIIGEADTVGVDSVVEFSVKFSSLGLKEGDSFDFYLKITTDGIGLARYPRRGVLTLKVPGKDFEMINWSA